MAILNAHLTTAASSIEVAIVANRKVATHVPGLKVPILRNLYNTVPGKNSHASPSRGMSGIPAIVETVFITPLPRQFKAAEA
jgi:hypothetical protein